VFCGVLARVAQFADIMRDSKRQIDKVYDAMRCLLVL